MKLNEKVKAIGVAKKQKEKEEQEDDNLFAYSKMGGYIMKNKNVAMLLSVVFAFLILPSLASAVCLAPSNDSTVLINTTTALCTGYYNDTHIVINSNSLILDCNASTLDGFDDTGNGITDNNHNVTQITGCTITNYEVGLSMSDSVNSSVWDNIFISNDAYDINTYRTTYTWFTTNNMTDGTSSIRLDDTSTDNIIIGNRISNMTDYGIALNQNCDDNTIYGNIIADIGLPSGGYCVAISNTGENYIYGNTLSGCRYGIYADTPSSVDIQHNTISDNADSGIFIDNDYENYTVANIDYNSVDTAGKEGIYAMGLTDSNITNNDITDVGNDGAFAGLFVYITNDTMISGNTIHDNSWAGVEIRGVFNTIFYNNVVWNNGNSGFIVMAESTKINILGNVFTNNTVKGIMMTDYPLRYSNITNNGIHDNAEDGIYMDCSEMVDPELELLINNNRLNNSGDEGIDMVDCNNVTVSGNNATYSAEDGLWLDGTDYITVTGGRYCNNNQSAGAFWDVIDEGSHSVFSNVLCDKDSPNTLCDYDCNYVPTPPTPSGTSNVIVLILAICAVLIASAILKKGLDGELDVKEIVISLVILGGLMAVFISVISAM